VAPVSATLEKDAIFVQCNILKLLIPMTNGTHKNEIQVSLYLCGHRKLLKIILTYEIQYPLKFFFILISVCKSAEALNLCSCCPAEVKSSKIDTVPEPLIDT